MMLQQVEGDAAVIIYGNDLSVYHGVDFEAFKGSSDPWELGCE